MIKKKSETKENPSEDATQTSNLEDISQVYQLNLEFKHKKLS